MSRALIILHCEDDRRRAMNWASKAPIGTRIEFKQTKRSLPQNDRMWAMLTDVARQIPWHGQKLTPDDWKLIFLDGLKGEITSVPNLDGTGFVSLRKSSDLSKDEMSNMMELIAAFGAEHRVIFKDDKDEIAKPEKRPKAKPETPPQPPENGPPIGLMAPEGPLTTAAPIERPSGPPRARRPETGTEYFAYCRDWAMAEPDKGKRWARWDSEADMRADLRVPIQRQNELREFLNRLDKGETKMAKDDKVILTPEQAESLLPEGEHIHNIANPNAGIVLGCDYTRSDAIDALRKAKRIELGGNNPRRSNTRLYAGTQKID